MVAGRLGKSEAVKDAVIHTNVHLGEAGQIGGFGIAVDIKVEGVEDEEVIKAGHEVCFVLRFREQGRHGNFVFLARLVHIAVHWSMGSRSTSPRLRCLGGETVLLRTTC